MNIPLGGPEQDSGQQYAKRQSQVQPAVRFIIMNYSEQHVSEKTGNVV